MKTFTNEIGNKIKLNISKVYDDGKNNETKQKYKFNAVKIQLEGPTSVSENIITNKEAYHMYIQLHNFFKSEPKKSTIKKII